MALQQASFYCPQCQQSRLFTREGVNNLTHALVTLFMCGLWLPVWIVILLSRSNAPFYCSVCGYSKSKSALVSPNGTGQIIDGFTQSSESSASFFGTLDGTTIGKYFKSMSNAERGFFGIIVLLVLIAFSQCGRAPSPSNQSANVNATSSANQKTLAAISPTPTAPTASPTVDNSAQVKAAVTKGEQIYKRIESRTKLPVMFGWRAQSITLMIPASDWNSLSKADQINLAYYAQNLTSVIRAKPKTYVDSWTKYYKAGGQVADGGETDGLTEGSYLSQAANLCDGCWSITVGKLKGGEFYEDTTPVSGGTFAEFQK